MIINRLLRIDDPEWVVAKTACQGVGRSATLGAMSPSSSSSSSSKEPRRHEPDTAIGGRQPAAFPHTPGSALLGIRSDDAVARARAFTAIVRAYWKPIYKRIRLRFRKSNEEAKDLTQAFFARALERNSFESYDPEVGRFRTYARQCVDNFVRNAEEARNALKRGGGAVPLSLHFDEAEDEILAAGAVETPSDEGSFDADFVRSLHDLSVETLEDDLLRRGRANALKAFRMYDCVEDPAERPTYAEIAAELGVKTSDVTNYLHATRRRLRGIVLAHLRQVTVGEEEFVEEAREILGIDPSETDGG